MNQTVARMLASKFGELVHPGDEKNPPIVLVLPGFRTAGMPSELIEQVSEHGRLISEAIVATIEDENVIINRAEYQQMREALEVTAPPEQQVVSVTCSACQTFLFSVNIATGNPTVNGPYFLETMQKMSAACPHPPVDA